MNLFDSPSRIFDLQALRRFCGGKPRIEKIGWFRNHIHWHRNTVIDADNISFILDEDPGENRLLVDGQEWDNTSSPAPSISCANYGSHMTTLATTRRNELLFRYRHGDMDMPEYPFARRHFAVTPHFMELLRQFSKNLDSLSEPGVADQQDLLALQMITEAFVSAEHAAETLSMPDPRIKIIANRIMSHPGEDFNVESAAAELGFSRASFYREWKKYSSVSPYHLLLENRLQTAEWFLAQTTMSMKEIALWSGFRNGSVFTEAFKKQFGIAPRDYRRTKEK